MSEKVNLLRVSALQPLELPKQNADGSTTYYVHFVDTTGKRGHRVCIKEVAQWITATKPDHNKRVDYVLSINDDGTVTSITSKPRADSMPGFKEESGNRSEDLVICLYADGTTAISSIPDRCPETVAQALNDSLSDMTEPLHPGVKVGRHILMRKIDEIGVTKLHFDPMPRD